MHNELQVANVITKNDERDQEFKYSQEMNLCVKGCPEYHSRAVRRGMHGVLSIAG
jgi:hypothetical protein